MPRQYPLFKVHMPVEAALAEMRVVLESGFINEGVQVTQLADALKIVLGAPSLVLTNSCTSAITLALALVGADPGANVVSTPMTCVATNTPIVAAGAQIKWSDIDPASGMPTAAHIAAKIDAQTRAVIVVAWAGVPPDLRAISAVCAERGIPLILDAAHAFGAEYEDQPVHAWADFTCYSLQAIKHFTSGDGGVLVCRDEAMTSRARARKWFGLDREAAKDAQGNWKGQQWDIDIREAGFKFNMNNVAAALGLAQLPHIAGILAVHRRNAAHYDSIFRESTQIVPAVRPLHCNPSFWVYTLRLMASAHARDALLADLNNEGIMAGLVHVPNDTYTAFQGCRAELPGVRAFAATQFSLPCGWWLADADIAHIGQRVLELTR